MVEARPLSVINWEGVVVRGLVFVDRVVAKKKQVYERVVQAEEWLGGLSVGPGCQVVDVG
jgi:hypothetical protein